MKGMKNIKISLAFCAICSMGVANAATVYNVTYSFESPATATYGGITYSIPTTGGGSGTAVLDSSAGITMTLHGEQVSDYSSYYGYPTAYSDVISDTTVQVNITNAGSGIFNLVQAGSYTEFTSCTDGPLDALNSCSYIPPGTTFSADGTAAFYDTQSFAVSGGVVKVITNGFGTTLTTDYTLTPVPLPAAAWMFGSSLVGLVGFARRRTELS